MIAAFSEPMNAAAGTLTFAVAVDTSGLSAEVVKAARMAQAEIDRNKVMIKAWEGGMPGSGPAATALKATNSAMQKHWEYVLAGKQLSSAGIDLDSLTGFNARKIRAAYETEQDAARQSRWGRSTNWRYRMLNGPSMQDIAEAARLEQMVPQGTTAASGGGFAAALTSNMGGLITSGAALIQMKRNIQFASELLGDIRSLAMNAQYLTGISRGLGGGMTGMLNASIGSQFEAHTLSAWGGIYNSAVSAAGPLGSIYEMMTGTGATLKFGEDMANRYASYARSATGGARGSMVAMAAFEGGPAQLRIAQKAELEKMREEMAYAGISNPTARKEYILKQAEQQMEFGYQTNVHNAAIKQGLAAARVSQLRASAASMALGYDSRGSFGAGMMAQAVELMGSQQAELAGIKDPMMLALARKRQSAAREQFFTESSLSARNWAYSMPTPSGTDMAQAMGMMAVGRNAQSMYDSLTNQLLKEIRDLLNRDQSNTTGGAY